MIEIINNLYLGDIFTIENYQYHQLDTFSLIINISNIPIRQITREYLIGINIIEIQFPDVPESNIGDYFDSTYNMINNCLLNEQKVLTYCKVGKSRSVSIIINYLMISQNISYELAFTQMITKKSSIGPNYGFIQQLKKHRYQSHSSPENLISGDLQQLTALHHQKIKELEGKKTLEEWGKLSKDREIERYLDSVLSEEKSFYDIVSELNNEQN
jgi:hypothetical protein